MKLDTGNFKEFVFGKLINEIYKAKHISKDDLTVSDSANLGIRYITRTGENNGCEFKADITSIPKEYIHEGNAITVGDTTATCFYQGERFITGEHIVIIRADWLDELSALYVITLLNNERYKYSYGRAFLINRIKETVIKLPIMRDTEGTPIIDDKRIYSDEGFIPDWQSVKKYIRSLNFKPLTTNMIKGQTPVLDTGMWKYFFLKDLCLIESGNKMDYSAMSFENPTVNFVGRSADNNGVAGKVDPVMGKNGKVIPPYRAGCVTVALGGSLGSAYLQIEDFYTSQNVAVLEFESDVSSYAKLFITTCIMNESKYKYFPFGRELNTHIKNDFGFTLPILRNESGDPIIDNTHRYSKEGYIPDWQLMENYIKSLPYGDRV